MEVEAEAEENPHHHQVEEEVEEYPHHHQVEAEEEAEVEAKEVLLEDHPLPMEDSKETLPLNSQEIEKGAKHSC